MDSIDVARRKMEQADQAFGAAVLSGSASIATLDVLAQRVADLEQAYYRACEIWEP